MAAVAKRDEAGRTQVHRSIDNNDSYASIAQGTSEMQRNYANNGSQRRVAVYDAESIAITRTCSTSCRPG